MLDFPPAYYYIRKGVDKTPGGRSTAVAISIFWKDSFCIKSLGCGLEKTADISMNGWKREDDWCLMHALLRLAGCT